MIHCFEITTSMVWFAGYILGGMSGVVCYRMFSTPNKPTTLIDYDGTGGKGYQPRRPIPPLPGKPRK